MITEIGNLVVETLEPSVIGDFDEIDTGSSDGSGEITVRANAVVRLNPMQFQFTQVSIETNGDYSTWSEEDLKDEACKMLANDYLEEAD